MVNAVIRCISSILDKQRFFRGNALYRNVAPYMHWCVGFLTHPSMPEPDKDTIAFYAKNAARVETVAK